MLKISNKPTPEQLAEEAVIQTERTDLADMLSKITTELNYRRLSS